MAWLGLSHFVFAYAGQARALAAGRVGGAGYAAALAFAAALLAAGRGLTSAAVFDAVVWTYFIPHFIKAEIHFLAPKRSEPAPSAAVLYWFPAAAFAFFSVALFGPRGLAEHSGWLILGAGLIALAGLIGRAREPLLDPVHSPYALVAFFLLAEAMVWGTYARWMTPQFREGVYAFHIAVASFYHYFRSYGFAARLREPGARPSYWTRIVLVNASVALAGVFVSGLAPGHPLQWVLGLPYFTFWVGLHLASSDAFTLLRRM